MRQLALPLLVIFLLSACAHGADRRDRADARAFVQESKRFTRVATPVLVKTAAKIDASFNKCDVVEQAASSLPPESRFTGASAIAYSKAVLPAYRRYAARLASRHARDPTLRGVAEAAGSIGRGYGGVERARFDYCRILREWRAAGWRKRFSVIRAIGLSEQDFTESGAPRSAEIRQAEKTAAASAKRLRELGVSEADAKSFVAATNVFADGRAG